MDNIFIPVFPPDSCTSPIRRLPYLTPDSYLQKILYRCYWILYDIRQIDFIWPTSSLEEGDRRQETGDRRKITWGF
ncbi:hypothetical protein [Okeania sp. SIO2B9]|uniref:hypothetical protein n=1 Tax=Okeania sp. SIO2B9 TaxID=2607782 RepID=UPI00142C97BD|nr:hypothetical protein [Okeania sp. SIO2B9]NES89840.1 hypothetical protein [Okeania sp. SIO2B9]